MSLSFVCLDSKSINLNVDEISLYIIKELRKKKRLLWLISISWSDRYFRLDIHPNSQLV